MATMRKNDYDRVLVKLHAISQELAKHQEQITELKLLLPRFLEITQKFDKDLSTFKVRVKQAVSGTGKKLKYSVGDQVKWVTEKYSTTLYKEHVGSVGTIVSIDKVDNRYHVSFLNKHNCIDNVILWDDLIELSREINND